MTVGHLQATWQLDHGFTDSPRDLFKPASGRLVVWRVDVENFIDLGAETAAELEMVVVRPAALRAAREGIDEHDEQIAEVIAGIFDESGQVHDHLGIDVDDDDAVLVIHRLSATAAPICGGGGDLVLLADALTTFGSGCVAAVVAVGQADGDDLDVSRFADLGFGVRGQMLVADPTDGPTRKAAAELCRRYADGQQLA